jgi:VanZ family protein
MQIRGQNLDGLPTSNVLKRPAMQPPPVPARPPGRTALFLRYWLPVLVWMTLIFSASADKASYTHSSRFFEPLLRWLFPHLPTATVEEVHHLFRKLCHLTEYAVLAWLVWRAIHKPARHDRRPWRWGEAGLALGVVFAYASSDEFHQLFVPGRTGLFSDVLIDTAGGAVGLLLLWAGRIIIRRR